MVHRILVFYGSYRSDRLGIRLANYLVAGFRARGDGVDLIDAKAIGLPMLDRMYKEYAPGAAPPAMERLAEKIRAADAFVFVTGEYNWGMQPGLKNLTDHFLEEWFWRPAAIASYSAGRFAGARAALLWHGTLSEMGMVVISSTISVGQFRIRWMNPAGRSASRGHCCSGVFRGSPRIWRGGQKRPRNSERARSRPFNDEVQPLAEAAETWADRLKRRVPPQVTFLESPWCLRSSYSWRSRSLVPRSFSAAGSMRANRSRRPRCEMQRREQLACVQGIGQKRPPATGAFF